MSRPPRGAGGVLAGSPSLCSMTARAAGRGTRPAPEPAALDEGRARPARNLLPRSGGEARPAGRRGPQWRARTLLLLGVDSACVSASAVEQLFELGELSVRIGGLLDPGVLRRTDPLLRRGCPAAASCSVAVLVVLVHRRTRRPRRRRHDGAAGVDRIQRAWSFPLQVGVGRAKASRDGATLPPARPSRSRPKYGTRQAKRPAANGTSPAAIPI